MAVVTGWEDSPVVVAEWEDRVVSARPAWAQDKVVDRVRAGAAAGPLDEYGVGALFRASD